MCPDCNCSFLGSEKFERHMELKHGKGNYKDNSGKFKSKVWEHFLLDRKNYRAKCLNCSSVISVKGGSATPKVGPLHTHLRSKHSINCSQIKWKIAIKNSLYLWFSCNFVPFCCLINCVLLRREHTYVKKVWNLCTNGFLCSSLSITP